MAVPLTLAGIWTYRILRFVQLERDSLRVCYFYARKTTSRCGDGDLIMENGCKYSEESQKQRDFCNKEMKI